MRVLVLLVTLAGLAVSVGGCIEHQLVPCGEKLCASGTTCVGERCASGNQLAACDGKGDGASCSVNAAVGACDRGVCVAVGCGNDILDADEVCDDGNTDYGDGCSGDCRSLESCGNGIVDFAKGESCDCASDAANKPAQCRFANSDDADAECSPACELRYCGDGAINALEQCDGTQVGALTCGDFGYYLGDLSCSPLCRHDVATCTGRCGDGAIDAAFGEFCDGPPPAGSCLDYGFDAGSVACSNACSPSVVRCERFGWQKLDDKVVVDLWARDTQVLVVSSTAPTAFMSINGIRTPAPAGTYSVAAGNDTLAFAVGPTTMAIWSGTAWTTVPVGWTSGTPTDAVANQAGLYVIVGGVIWRYASSAWTQSTETGMVGLTASNLTVFAWNATAIRHTTGVTWADVAATGAGGTFSTVAATPTGRLWAIQGVSLLRRDPPSAWIQVGNAIGTQSATTSAGDFIVSNGNALIRYSIAAGAETLAPPITPSRVAVDNDGGIVIGGNAGTFRLRTGAWFSVEVDSGWTFVYEEYDVRSFTVNATGFRVINGYWGPWGGMGGGYAPLLDGDPFYYPGADLVTDGAMSESGEYLMTTADGIYNRSNGLLEIASADVGLGLPPRAMTAAGDGELLAVGNGFFARDKYPNGAGWHFVDVGTWNLVEVTRGEGSKAIALKSDGRVVAIDEDASGTVTYDYPDTIVPQVGFDALIDIWATPFGDVLAVSPTRLWIYSQEAFAWTYYPLTGLTARCVSGTSMEDVFVGGDVVSFSNQTGLVHWDGTELTPVRIPTPGSVWDLHVTPQSIIYLRQGRFIHDITRAAIW